MITEINIFVGKIKAKDIIFKEDIYARFKPDPKIIQKYSNEIEIILAGNAIQISKNNILIDGYHRWKAVLTKFDENYEIPCIIHDTDNNDYIELKSYAANAKHGLPNNPDEIARNVRRLFAKGHDSKTICTELGISESTFYKYTEEQRKQIEEEINNKIFDLYLACYTQKEIAEKIETPQAKISEKIAKIIKNSATEKWIKSANFEDGFTPELYSIWNFGKATNEVRHFGNIPPEIIDNLIYYYTKPFDIIFDPFGGGGSTIDKCIERKRRYYVSDLNPIPARVDIRKHDITIGLPDDLPVPDLVFLDPPYWKQAEKKYSEDQTDLSNVDLEIFLESIGNIAKWVKRKWTDTHSGKLAIIIGPWKENGKFIDLPFLCYERISKYLTPVQRIIVPYSTQVHGGAFVNMAKEKKEILYLARDLVVFER